MKILAIDLGETTGWVVLHDEAMVSHGVAVLLTPIPKHAFDVDLVVIERPAYIPNRMQEHYSNALSDYRKLHQNVKTVRPADWMPRFMHYPLPERGVLKTQHEKDAYRMAKWAMEKFSSGKKLII